MAWLSDAPSLLIAGIDHAADNCGRVIVATVPHDEMGENLVGGHQVWGAELPSRDGEHLIGVHQAAHPAAWPQRRNQRSTMRMPVGRSTPPRPVSDGS